MKEKYRRPLALLLGLVLLLTSLVMACGEPTDSSPPAITVGPSSINFDLQQGKVGLPNQVLSLWNSGGGTLTWNTGDNADWLSLSPSSGSSRGEIDNITLSVDTSGMDAGDYTAIVTITASGAANSPQTVIVNLTVNTNVHQEDEAQKQKSGQEEVIDALDTARLLEIGYNNPEQVVTVQGVIVRAYYAEKSKGQPTFLDFHDPYQGYFKCIIWEKDKQTGQPIREKFITAFMPNPETYFLNKKVRVNGRIEIYKGDPEIILHDSAQIWVVE